MAGTLRAALAAAVIACAVPLALAQGSAADEIEKYRQALQDAHANLESEVQQRTEELRQANESLRKIEGLIGA